MAVRTTVRRLAMFGAATGPEENGGSWLLQLLRNRLLAPGTINLRVGAVRRLVYAAS
jgi:hypothetical protein